MKKLLSIFLAAVMCFGTFSGVLAERSTVRELDPEDGIEAVKIETNLPSGVYDGGRTLIFRPEEGDMLFSYDPDEDAALMENLSAEEDGMRDTEGPMVLPSDFTEMLKVPKKGFLEPIGSPVEGSIPISNVKELYDLRLSKNQYKCFHLTRDLDMADLSKWGLSWDQSYINFKGTFDGQGHTIRGLTSPLFSTLSGDPNYSNHHLAKVKNLAIEVNIVDNRENIGGFARSGRYFSFYNCIAGGSITGTMTTDVAYCYIGGFVGSVGTQYNYGSEFKSCYSDVDITFNNNSTVKINAAGMLCSGGATFTNCINSGTVDLHSRRYAYAAGLCGPGGAGTFTNCINIGAISANGRTGAFAAGISISGRYSGCVNKGSVTANCIEHYDSPTDASAGGISLHGSYIEYTNCINTGAVSASSGGTAYAFAGGIQGFLENDTISHCVNQGPVTATANGSGNAVAGGLSNGAATIIDCYSDGNVSAHSVGGDAFAGGAVAADMEIKVDRLRVFSSRIHAQTDAADKYAYSGGVIGGQDSNYTASVTVGRCLVLSTGVTAGASDDAHTYKGSIAGHVKGAVVFTDSCAYSMLLDHTEYYESVEGFQTYVQPLTGIKRVTANYMIKAVDAQSNAPIANTTLLLDGYPAVTDSNGFARITLPVNTVLKTTAEAELYENKLVRNALLSTNCINLLSLDYAGDPTGDVNGGSGQGCYIPVAGHSITIPSISTPKVTANGPNTTVQGNTSPAFKLDFSLNLGPVGFAAKYDAAKQSMKILINIEGVSNLVDSEVGDGKFMKKWNSVIDGFHRYIDDKPSDIFKDIKSNTGSFGVDGVVSFGGFADISFANGQSKVLDGGVLVKLEVQAKSPRYPIWYIAYFQFKIAGGIDASMTITLDEHDAAVFTSDVKHSISITGMLSTGDPLGLISIGGGLKGEVATNIHFPFESIYNSLTSQVTLSLVAEINLLVFSTKYTKNIGDPIQIWPINKIEESIDLTQYLNGGSMRLEPRDYLENTAMLRAAGDETLVMNSVYPYGEPRLAQLPDGRLVLVWVHDDGSRTDENRTALYYSVYDEGAWSTPAMVWDDGTADFSPAIAADADGVHIVWQNMSEVIPEGADLNYYLTRTQLVYTRLNADGTFETPFTVDGEGLFQAKTCIAAENGNAVVAWEENNANNVWNNSGSYSVYRRCLTDSEWESAVTVNTASFMPDVACGFVDGEPVVAFVRDTDNNCNTSNDLDIWKYVGSALTRVTNNSLTDNNIQFVNNDLYWQQDGMLRNASGTLGLESGDDILLMTAPGGSLAAVIKSAADGFNTELYGCFMNAEGEWSAPAPITNYYGAIRSFCPIVCVDGTIAVALDDAEVLDFVNDGDEAYGTTSMHVIVGSSLTDLIVTGGVYYDVDDVVPDESITMTVDVYNNSINAVNGVEIGFYDENDQCVFSTVTDDIIECGEEKEIEFAYAVPEMLSYREYTVKVLPAGIADDIPENNIASVEIGYADAAIENAEFIRTENGGRIEADISNIGFDAAENVNVYLRCDGSDGELLGSVAFGDMAAGATEHVSFDIPAEYLGNESLLDLNIFYLCVECDSFEAHAANNSEIVADEPIRVTEIAISDESASLFVHDTIQLSAEALPAEAVDRLIVWTSDNTDVAIVDENGLVEAVGEGEAVIYAVSDDGSHWASCTISTVYHEYTVTFLDDDGTVLVTEQVKETQDATPPEVAEREGWTFTGWDGDYTNISGDITLTAQYQINTYQVIYIVNGEVFHADEFEYGAEIVPLDEPEIEGYTFIGWDDIPAVMPAEDVIVTGEVEINSYRLNYYVDGTFYQRVTYEYGAEITPLEEPTREDYVFNGWSEIPETMPAHNVSVYGTFSIMTFTVTFLDWDDSVIEEQQVEIHADAVAPADPERTGYTFAGWDGDFTAVTEDITVRATYTINEYTVTFMDWDGTVLSEQVVEYGSSAIAPEIPERPGYTFTGWDVDFSCIDGDTVVTAQYINNAEIKYYEKTETAELTSGYYVIYGVNGDYCGAMNNILSSNRMGLIEVEIVDERIQNPDKSIIWYIDVGDDGVITLYNEASENYVEITINNASGFSLASEPTCGYTYEFDEVTGTYLLQSTSETGGDRCISIYQTDFRCLTSGGAKELYLYKMENNHTVTFVDWNGTVLAVQQVEDGSAAVAPDEPEREGYSFTGWDVEFENVTEDIVVTALYSINSYALTINYIFEDGSPAADTYSAEYEYGASYYIESPGIDGFTADIPVVEGTIGAEDLIVNVTYSSAYQVNPGDVDLDGEITAADALLAMRHAMSVITVEGQGFVNGDMDGDGVITATDAILIMRSVLQV